MINGHGNNLYQFEQLTIEGDFSSNIAFNNNAGEILDHLKDNLSTLRNYPDPMASKLTSLIAQSHSVSPERVLVTNGSAEAFYLVAHMLAKSSHRGSSACRTAITTPSFAEYEDSCSLYNHDIRFVELCDFGSLSIAELDSLWLASPNNPDAQRVSIADIYALASTNRGCKIVLDRAYNELSNNSEECGVIPQNVILIESFTKLYGIPGLRLGYIIASAEVISFFDTIRTPWSVNSLSLIAGEYIATNTHRLRPDIDELIGESQYLQLEIDKIEGFEVTPSPCNFFLVRITHNKSAAELSEYLLHKHGLLIRDCSNFRGATTSHFRVAAQRRELNDKLINALRQWR